LLGHIVNTNTAYLGQKLAELGIDVYRYTTVGDNPERLANSIKEALKRSDIVVTTGGLGPTVDDITAATIAKLIPEKARLIRNKVGTAPGLIIEYKDKVIICLPGPPREMEPMFQNDITPYLRKLITHYSLLTTIIKSRTIKLTGLSESKIDAKVKDLLTLKPLLP